MPCKRIFLINPPYYFLSGLEYLTQNLGLGYLAAVLEKEGRRVEVLDALAEGSGNSARVNVGGRWVNRVGLPYDEIVKRIPGEADLICITAPFSNHATIIDELAATIKGAFPSTPIVLGGVYPSTQPERALKSGVDYIVVGEGERALRSLASGEDPASIPGVWYMDGGEVKRGGLAEQIPDIDDLPFPARELFPMDKYFALSPRSRPGQPTATMITSRGCPFDCNFCSIHPVYGRKWRARSSGNVLAEVDELIGRWGARIIEFEDDNLTLDPERAKAIFEGLKSRPVNWICANGLRVDTLDRELLELMRDSGCEAVHLAIESGDPEMLKMMNKKLDLEKIEQTVSICNELKIPTVAFIIVGYPGETHERFQRSLRLVGRLKKMGMVACGVHIATPYPGTKLYETCRERNWLINKNAAERVMLPGDVHIRTEDFSRMDVLERLYLMQKAVSEMHAMTTGWTGFYRWKIKPKLSRLRLVNRRYAANIPDKKLEGFYEPQKWFDGVTFRWSKGDAAMHLNFPEGAKTLKLTMKSDRDHAVEVFLDDVSLGMVYLTDTWKEHDLKLPKHIKKGANTLRFESDAVSPRELGYDEEARKQGFILSWFEIR